MKVLNRYRRVGENRRRALIEARERRGMTRAQLARLLGMSQTYVMRVEEGDRTPRPLNMYHWADTLGISLDAFRYSPRQDAAA